MRLPKRLDTILKKKEAFLNDVRAKLEKTVLKLQISLFEQVIGDIIPRLDVRDGVILETTNNYRLISELEKTYDTFNLKIVKTLLPQINEGIKKITKFSQDYFTIALAGNLPGRFEKIIESAKVITNLKIGLRAEKMIRGGQLMSMLDSKEALTELKQLLSKAVTSQIDMKEFIKLIKEKINGTEEKVGSLERQFKRYAYDTYAQYDSAYNKKLAEEFGMRYFIYQGGLVIDSRDFCVCHNGKVFSIEETEDWKDWTPDQCDYPDSHPMQSKEGTKYPPNVVPGYLQVPGYDPLVDRGGYNCRHIIGWIADELAYKYRPELK